MAETKAARNNPAPFLYESDFYRWIGATAQHLRNRDASALDWENLTEEIEDLGRSASRELRNRLRVLMMHLLKWQFQPELRDGSTWRATIREHRRQIASLFEQSPSLKPQLARVWSKVYRDAAEDAADEMGTDKNALPVSCPFTREQVLDLEFLPQ